MNIGVGILTYNRPILLNKTIDVILHNGHSELANIDYFIYDDGSDIPEVFDVLNKYKLPYVSKKTESIAQSKNNILKHLYNKGADIIFLFEDDFYIDTQYIDTIINSIQQSGFPHFVFDHKHLPLGEIVKDLGEIKLTKAEFGTGCFGTFTRELLETVGLFDEVFKIYGNEHMDYDNRCVNNGYLPCLVEIANLKPYISDINYCSILSHEIRDKWTNINNNYYDTNSTKKIPIDKERTRL